jgi:UDP-GlcNAc:undecaprenyl-phosphate/decaprenyl-phosphate GlcNAc-1-phosphate transferase
MTALSFLLALSFGLCLFLTPLIRRLAERANLVDRPDGGRKMHGRPVPVAGGLAIFASGSLALAVLLVVPSNVYDGLARAELSLPGLFLAALVLCVVGVLDDFGYLRGRHKILGQFVAVGVLMGFGLMVRHVRLFGWEIELGLLAAPFTCFILLGAINSLNLIDGMDGLLTSVGLVLSLALAALALYTQRWASAAVALALAGALLGFLRYNFPPASIFLGDAGSMVIGLVLGTLAIQCSSRIDGTMSLSAPVVLLLIPIFDTTAAILRRKLTGRSIYTTDRGHLHHVLLRRGLSVRHVLLLICFFCLLSALGALASYVFDNELIALFTALGVIALLMPTRLFGHVEALLVKERLVGLGKSLLKPRPHDPARQLTVSLQGTADWSELWGDLTARALELNLRQVRLDVNAPALHENFHARWDRHALETETPDLWRAEIPLAAHGRIVGRLEVAGQRDDEPIWQKIARIARLVEEFEAAMTDLAGPHGNAAPEIKSELLTAGVRDLADEPLLTQAQTCP